MTFRSPFLAATLALGATAAAHPVHATFAEAVWNPKTHAIEVALRVRGLDLEDALSKGREKRIDLGKTEGVDALIRSYLDKKFTLKRQDGSVLQPDWSDKEVGLTNTWIYFSFPLGQDGKPAGCKMTNTLFFDDLEGQQNVVEYREGRAKGILSFSDDKREITVRAAD